MLLFATWRQAVPCPVNNAFKSYALRGPSSAAPVPPNVQQLSTVLTQGGIANLAGCKHSLPLKQAKISVLLAVCGTSGHPDSSASPLCPF